MRKNKKQIRLLLLLFAVVLALYLAGVVSGSYYRHVAFEDGVYSGTQTNLQVTGELGRLQVALSVYQKAIQDYLITGHQDQKTLITLYGDGVAKKMAWLDQFNQTLFPHWSTPTVGDAIKAKDELRQHIVSLESREDVWKGQVSAQGAFQVLVGLVMVSLADYLDQTGSLVHSFDQETLKKASLQNLETTKDQVALLQSAIDVLIRDYDAYFWSDQHFKDSQFYAWRNRVLLGLIVVSSLIFLFFVFLLWRVSFLLRQVGDGREQAVLLSARDLETGLFNKQSFQVFGAQELARAKRHGTPLTLLFLRVESYAQIRDQKGEKDAEHFVYQVAQLLRKTCRVYDGVFRYSENAFAVLMAESSRDHLYPIMARISQAVFEQEFFIHDDKLKSKPRINVGYAFYPDDGASLDELIQKAVLNMTDQNGKPVASEHREEKSSVPVEKSTAPTTVIAEQTHAQQVGDVSVAVEPLVVEHGSAVESSTDDFEVLVSHKDYEPEAVAQDDDEESAENGADAPSQHEAPTPPVPAPRRFVSGPIDDAKLRATWESLVAREVPANFNAVQPVPDLLGKKTEQTEPKDVVTQLLESVVARSSQNLSTEKSVEDVVGAMVPDVVAALSQAESVVKNLPDMMRQQDSVSFAPFSTSPSRSEPTKTLPPEPVVSERNSPDAYAQVAVKSDVSPAGSFEMINDDDDDFDDITNISDIQIVNSEEDGDVIMVDFDEEKPDLATKFRKKIRDQRRKLKMGL